MPEDLAEYAARLLGPDPDPDGGTLLTDLRRALVEVERLRRTLAVERGDVTAAPDGWKVDGVGDWGRDYVPGRVFAVERVRNQSPGWRAFWHSTESAKRTSWSDHAFALDGMTCRDEVAP